MTRSALPSPRWGEVKMISFSRRDARPRHAVQRVKHSAEHHRVTPEPAVGPAFGSIMLWPAPGSVDSHLS